MFPAITPSQLVHLYGKAFSANTEPVVVKKTGSLPAYTQSQGSQSVKYSTNTQSPRLGTLCAVFNKGQSRQVVQGK